MQELTLWEHLMELKNTILKLLASWVVCTLGVIPFHERIFAFITEPLGTSAYLFTPVSGVLFYLRVYLLLGFILAFPFLLWFTWQYLIDLFDARGRRYVQTLIPVSLGLAYLGVVYGYFFLIPSSIDILLSFQPPNTQYLIGAEDYISFVLGLLLIMVFIFQIPLVIFTSIKARLISAGFYAKHRKEFYFGFVVLTAVFTPTPDVFTLFLIVIPMLVMYEIALLLGRV